MASLIDSFKYGNKIKILTQQNQNTMNNNKNQKILINESPGLYLVIIKTGNQNLILKAARF